MCHFEVFSPCLICCAIPLPLCFVARLSNWDQKINRRCKMRVFLHTSGSTGWKCLCTNLCVCEHASEGFCCVLAQSQTHLTEYQDAQASVRPSQYVTRNCSRLSYKDSMRCSGASAYTSVASTCPPAVPSKANMQATALQNLCISVSCPSFHASIAAACTFMHRLQATCAYRP